jgi:hypothetical protein
MDYKEMKDRVTVSSNPRNPTKSRFRQKIGMMGIEGNNGIILIPSIPKILSIPVQTKKLTNE